MQETIYRKSWKKTTVDFASVDSNIYHCFLFLDLPLVMSDLDPF